MGKRKRSGSRGRREAWGSAQIREVHAEPICNFPFSPAGWAAHQRGDEPTLTAMPWHAIKQYDRSEQVTTRLPTLAQRRASYRGTGPKMIVLRTKRSVPWHVGSYSEVMFSPILMTLNDFPSMLDVFEGEA